MVSGVLSTHCGAGSETETNVHLSPFVSLPVGLYGRVSRVLCLRFVSLQVGRVFTCVSLYPSMLDGSAGFCGGPASPLSACFLSCRIGLPGMGWPVSPPVSLSFPSCWMGLPGFLRLVSPFMFTGFAVAVSPHSAKQILPKPGDAEGRESEFIISVPFFVPRFFSPPCLP